ncbi:uncharacterized protein LOC120006428 isoform X2 [Tripterygium wilfordii]|uniref:uncharacterized protein LOC120006428 isoform X2 n=1 Tax=Tripterygium wilfordii TaxID=458696 RepID=UPI0018F7EEE2|nr:uncharacterized protein LOC120006428 isoform X2 [Tripterygium wilfordii]
MVYMTTQSVSNIGVSCKTMRSYARFLRQRYKHLMQNQSQSSLPERECPESSEIRSRNVAIKSSRNGKKAALPPPVPPFDLNRKGKPYIERQATLKNPALRPPVPPFDLNKKGKTYVERQATFKNPASSFDLSQKHKSYGAKEVALQDSRSIIDLNEKERIESGKEAAVRNATPVFDLNQILIDEEELHGNRQPLRAEELKKSSIRAGSDEQYSETMLSACRNIGNGPSKSGKRKISWQDQLALRV